MATDTRYGFKFEGLLYDRSGIPTVETHIFKDSEDLTEGDLVNLESGEVDLAATSDTGLLGIALETKTGVDSTTEIEVITNPDAIYSVYDANARIKGAKLDFSGATGQMTVATDSNHDLLVVANSAADERTLVMINPGHHVMNA